jgi:hypothetical protein
MNELVSPLEQRAESIESVASGREAGRAKTLVVESLGPVTILAGIVWAIAQPYRIVFLRDTEKGLWDYLGQPPLLVVFVGLVFALLIAPGLADDLRNAADDVEGDHGASR